MELSALLYVTTIGKFAERSQRFMVNRHADTTTVDHIIELRKRVANLEWQLDNALSWIMPMQRENDRLTAEVKRITDHNEWLQKKRRG